MRKDISDNAVEKTKTVCVHLLIIQIPVKGYRLCLFALLTLLFDLLKLFSLMQYCDSS